MPSDRRLTKREQQEGLARAARLGQKVGTEKQQEAALQRHATYLDEQDQTREAVQRRRQWEADVLPSPPTHPLHNPTMDQLRQVQATVPDRLVTPAPSKFDDDNPPPPPKNRMLNAQQIYRTSMPLAQIYAVKGWDRRVGPRAHPSPNEVPLPGMEHPHAVATPPHWDELTDRQQKDTEARVERSTGASLDSMERSFGAQLDQAHIRADLMGGEPHAKNFYGHGEPKQVLKQSARELDVPFGVIAAHNAFTSPNSRFKSGGRYPNNEAAMAAVDFARSGHPTPEDIVRPGAGMPVNPRDPAGKRLQGYPKNLAKAVKFHTDIESGTPLRELRGENGDSPFGPKTGPYHNSWLDSHPDFFVADLHSGGGGMVPHLSSAHALQYDADGNVRMMKSHPDRPDRAKSEREAAIEKKGFHTLADEAARRAVATRGMPVLREAQAAQWGEEQIQRGQVEPSIMMPPPKEEHEGQLSFDLTDTVPVTRAPATRTHTR